MKAESEKIRRPLPFSGLTIMLIATMIAGIAAYVVTWLVPRQVGFASYTVFAVFWSFMYLVVGTLGGIQQEVTRGTSRVAKAPAPRVSKARNFAMYTGIFVFVVILATAPAWVTVVFPAEGWALVLPLAIGAASYVLVATLAGSLYGLSEWMPLALMLVVDSLMRLIALIVVLQFTSDVVALAWTVAVPFPLTLLLLWPFIRKSIVGRTELDVGYRALVRNIGQTVVAAGATGLMVSGFPLLLGLVSRSEPKDLVGLYILSITLTRAPLIVIALSLQSYLVVTFKRPGPGSPLRRLLMLMGVAAVVLAIAGWLLGPAVFGFLFPGQLVPEGSFLSILVLSSAIVGMLCITGPAVLARSRHLVYSGGWVVAALVTIAMLLLPLEFSLRTILALLAGPLAGLLVHAIYLLRHRAVNTDDARADSPL